MGHSVCTLYIIIEKTYKMIKQCALFTTIVSHYILHGTHIVNLYSIEIIIAICLHNTTSTLD